VVVNNTRVFPARLLGHRVPSGGAVECLLVRPVLDEHPKTLDNDLLSIRSRSDRNPVAIR